MTLLASPLVVRNLEAGEGVREAEADKSVEADEGEADGEIEKHRAVDAMEGDARPARTPRRR